MNVFLSLALFGFSLHFFHSCYVLGYLEMLVAFAIDNGCQVLCNSSIKLTDNMNYYSY